MAENVSSPVANLPEEIYGNRPIRCYLALRAACAGPGHSPTGLQRSTNRRALVLPAQVWLHLAQGALLLNNQQSTLHPLLSSHPQDCVPFLEEAIALGRASELEALPSQQNRLRLQGTEGHAGLELALCSGDALHGEGGGHGAVSGR